MIRSLATCLVLVVTTAGTAGDHNPPQQTTSAPVQPTHAWGSEEFAALSETDLVPESSGVIASRLARDVYWTHNDSGSEKPRVWAFRLSPADRQRHVARHLGYVELPGASNGDWEDIAAGPGGRIYVFDGGDNPPCKRRDKQIIRFVEPKIDPDGPPVALTAEYESIRFEYPDPSDASRPASRNDDRFDAECLFVHPVTGDMYVVTKRTNRDHPIARVYKLPADKVAWGKSRLAGARGSDKAARPVAGARGSDRVHVLRFVIELNATTMNMVTGGDIDRAGRRVVLRNYWEAFEYELPPGKPFDEIFGCKPRQISLLKQAAMLLQGEGICYSADGRDLIMTTESPRGPQDEKFRVFIVRSVAAGTQPSSSAPSR